MCALGESGNQEITAFSGSDKIVYLYEAENSTTKIQICSEGPTIVYYVKGDTLEHHEKITTQEFELLKEAYGGFKKK